eukprot:2892812-Heterocapsa_arctica.AAC.1
MDLFETFAAQHYEVWVLAERFATPGYDGPSDDLVAAWERALRSALGAPPEAQHQSSSAKTSSPLKAELLKAWLEKGGDPEVQLYDWIREGVPLGIECPITYSGIFPPVSDIMDPIDAPTVEEAILSGVGNYTSMTINPTEAAAELARFLQEGYGVRITREHAMATFADGSFSRLALILKT